MFGFQFGKRQARRADVQPYELHGFFDGIGNAGATLTVALYVYAKEQGEFQAAFSIAVILMLLSVIVNLSAEIVKAVCKRKKEGQYGKI